MQSIKANVIKIMQLMDSICVLILISFIIKHSFSLKIIALNNLCFKFGNVYDFPIRNITIKKYILITSIKKII